MSSTRQLAAIMFTDIAGYTAVMGEDEQKAFKLLGQNRRLQRPLIEAHHGRWIKELGDGVLASFLSVSDAVQAAVEIQEACRRLGTFALRIGIHHGEVVVEDDDIFGDAVNIASRLQAIAPVGGIWISEAVHQNIANKKDFTTRFVRSERLKHVKEPVRVYEVRTASSGPTELAAGTFARRPSKKWGRVALLAALVLALFIPLAFLLYQKEAPPPLTPDSPSVSEAPAAEASIAVLPFVNRSNDAQQEYFSDGLSEELLNLLARVPELKVTARTSSFAFKGKNEDVRTISRQLGVNYILEGSVRRQGSRVRITAQLVHAREGTQLWSETYDRVMNDIFQVQDEIANAVVRELKPRLLASSAVRLVSGTSANPEVHNLVLQGNYIFDRLDKQSVERALQLYEQALALDSLDARAWAMVAKAWSRAAWQNYTDQNEGYEKARAAAQKAISLNPNATDGLLVLGGVKMYHDFDWAGARQAFEKILRVEPSNAAALNNLACLEQMLGRWDRAIEGMKRALALDPIKPIFYSNQGANYTYTGKFREANAHYRKALEINPQFQRAHMYLARNYLLQGDAGRALQEAQLEPMEVFRRFGLALVYAAQGKKAEADGAAQQFAAAYGKDWPYLVAELQAFRGEKEDALAWLQKAYAKRDSWLVWVKGDPLLKSVWDAPRYKSLLQQMNLPVD